MWKIESVKCSSSYLHQSITILPSNHHYYYKSDVAVNPQNHQRQTIAKTSPQLSITLLHPPPQPSQPNHKPVSRRPTLPIRWTLTQEPTPDRQDNHPLENNSQNVGQLVQNHQHHLHTFNFSHATRLRHHLNYHCFRPFVTTRYL